MRANYQLLFILLSLFFVNHALIGQGWIRTASSSDAIPTPDGNFLSIGAGVAKATPEAEIIWRSLLRDSSIYSSDSTSADTRAATFLPNGDILAVGQVLYRPVLPDGTIGFGFARSEGYWATFSPTGELLQEQKMTFGDAGGRDEFTAVKPTADGGALLFGYQDYPSGDDQTLTTRMLLIKVDATAEFVWQADLAIPENIEEFGTDMLALPDGTFTLIGHRKENALSRSVNLINVDAEGNLNWEQALDGWTNQLFFGAPSLVHCPDGGYFLADHTGPGFPNLFPRVVKTDSDGNTVWSHTFSDDFPGTPLDVEVATDGGYLVIGTAYDTPERPNTDIFFRKYNEDGSIAWTRLHGGPGDDRGSFILTHPDNGYIFTGVDGAFDPLTGLPGGISLGSWFRTDSLGLIFSNEINGNIFEDFDLDCAYFGEEGFPQWLVARSGVDGTEYTVTDNNGFYEFSSNSGSYTISIPNKSPYWDGCFDPVTTQVETQDTSILHLPQQVNVECPYLQVDISASFLRRCFESTYTVTYCNRGTLAAEDTYIEVELDSFLNYVSSTIPFTSNVDNVLTFEIGEVDLNACGTFQLTVLVDCESTVLGQTHCTTARVFPDTLCLETPLWSGASLDVTAACQGDSVLFTVTNVGTAPTTAAIQYLVIEDQVILREGDAPVLLPDASISFTEPAFGATMRLEVEQEPNHPGNSRPAISVEGCSTDGDFSLGYVTQFWENDGDPFVSIDCQENIGSFDPNDKRAFPKGYGEDHLIEANEDLEYHIRFQNTGTDTAFTVVVRDLISNFLDLGSITPGAASHPYEWEIVDGRVVQFTFNDINLVDSLSNEPLSHGFVKFRIKQVPDLPNGIQIENEAAIFFDFNEPIITNQTFHTIGEDFVTSIFEPENTNPDYQLRAWPNPFSERTTIALNGWSATQEMHLHVFDALGREVRHQVTTGSSFEFERKRLPSGLYFFQLKSDGELLSQGKLLMQEL